MKNNSFLIMAILMGLISNTGIAQKNTAELKNTTRGYIDKQFGSLSQLSDQIWAFEEIAFQERVVVELRDIDLEVLGRERCTRVVHQFLDKGNGFGFANVEGLRAWPGGARPAAQMPILGFRQDVMRMAQRLKQ